jgi:hypothetical protein
MKRPRGDSLREIGVSGCNRDLECVGTSDSDRRMHCDQLSQKALIEIAPPERIDVTGSNLGEKNGLCMSGVGFPFMRMRGTGEILGGTI